MVTVVFFSSGAYYKLELRYEELEDFIVLDSNVDTGVKRVFLTVKHPPRPFQNVANKVLQDEDANDDDNQADNDGYVSDSLDDWNESSESETDSFSTDEEYPDELEVTNFGDRSSPRNPRGLDDETIWETVSHIQDSENAWGHCFTYSFAILCKVCKESIQMMCLLAALQNRFQIKAVYCRVKEKRDVRDTKYARYQRVLKASKQRRNRPFTVQEDLWKDIRLICFIKSTKFTSNVAQRGFLFGLFGLTVYQTCSECRCSTKGFQDRSYSMGVQTLGAELSEDLTEKDAMKTFLHEVWEFSFSLSSFVPH